MRKNKGKVFVVTKTSSSTYEEVEKAVFHPFSHTLEIYRHSPFGVFCHEIVSCEYDAKIRSVGIKVKVGEH